MVITLKNGWIGWWSFFAKFNYVNARDNYMQVYKQNNIKTIAYKVK